MASLSAAAAQPEANISDNIIPQEMICCITGEIMENPVITLDGNSYERAAIERWFAEGRITSPLTGLPLGTTHLTPNQALRRAITELIDTKLPQLKEQERVRPNLEKVIQLREEDLRQLKQDTVPRQEYDRILRLLEQTKEEHRKQSILLEQVRTSFAHTNALLQGGVAEMPSHGTYGSGGGGGGAAAEEEEQQPAPTGRQEQAFLENSEEENAKMGRREELTPEEQKRLDSELISAAREGKATRVGDLLGQGASIHAKDSDGRTALIYASIRGHTEIVALLVEKGADKEAKDNSGNTALIRASVKGHTETVALLVEKGADVEAKTEAGDTALIAASRYGRTATVALLVEKGATS